MRFKSEDEAIDYYYECCQEECGFDITESSGFNSLIDDFDEWAEVKGVTWDE